jgi:hypothetical protein
LVVNLTIHLTLLNNTYLRPFSIQKWGWWSFMKHLLKS